jgi:hypothetical protein
MATFFIEICRKGGKIYKLAGAQSKLPVGQPFECAVGKQRVKAHVLAIRHYSASRFGMILAQEGDARATLIGGAQRAFEVGMQMM